MVPYILFFLLLTLVSFLEHTRLSSALAGPDLSLALLSYIIIASSEKTVLVRAWALGLMMDLWNPYTTAWYMLWYLCIAVLFLPLRSIVFQKSFSGWFLWAATLHIIMAYLLAGDSQLYANWGRIIFDACATGMFSVIIGAACNEMPKIVHPLGGPDVP